MRDKIDNYFYAIEILEEGNIRVDHFNGQHALYRFAAMKNIGYLKYRENYDESFKALIGELNSMTVRPNQVFVSEYQIEIVWYANFYQVVNNRSQYAGLALEFAHFLNESPVKGLRFQGGAFSDDPQEIDFTDLNNINFHPEFNSSCFGLRSIQEIEITEMPY